ncbi:hypothetical protein VPHK479_0094 [Vibrio phage K479]
MNTAITEVLADGNLKALAEDLGITYSNDNVICYPSMRTKSAFMLACYGSYAQAEQIIKERGQTNEIL